jgi:hypothetical protein
VKGAVCDFLSVCEELRGIATPAYAEHSDFAWSISSRFDIMRRKDSRNKFIHGV